MLQILGLRPRFDSKKSQFENKEVFYDKGWRAASVAALFNDLEAHIRHIPQAERWNLFYTVANCFDAPGRKMEFSDAIAFDIDRVPNMDRDKAMQVGRLVCEAIGVPYDEVGIVFSGNGTHILVGLKDRITSPEYFDLNRGAYRLLLDRIEAKLHANGFEAALADPAVFNRAIMMRLPGTENRKPDKLGGEVFPGEKEPEFRIRKPVELLQGRIIPQAFNLKDRAGIIDLPPEDHVSPTALKRFPRPDTDAVLNGCEFLKCAKADPESLSEPEWYASLSILANVFGQDAAAQEKGRALAHEYSKGHPQYSSGETDAKITQAIEQSGPRTCKNIDALWGGCKVCPHYKTTLLSPITIRGENYIKTRDQGFHFEKVDRSGNVVPGKPAYEDLRKFYELEHPYIVLEGSEIVYGWTGTHWEEIPDSRLERFAQKHFKPTADNKMVNEFVGILYRHNHRKIAWFSESVERKMNFKNGVLDIDTMNFSEHSQKLGFRHVLPYDYDATAAAPRFEQFLQEVTDGRQELTDVLLEFAGYAFSNDSCWAQKALILSGMGRNGKSILLDTIRLLAGKGNYSSVNLADLSKDTGRYLLEGKPFNLAEETPTNSLADSTNFKNLVTGGEMLVKQLYKQPYTVENRAKLILSCNELPHTGDLTAALFRRMIIVPFDVEFIEGAPNHDPFIGEKLRKELPGIFNLVIEGYKRLRRQGKFTMSQASKDALDSYREEADTVIPFYKEAVKVESIMRQSQVDESKTFLASIDLYANYRIYCEERGRKPSTFMVFSKRFHRILPFADIRQARPMVKSKRSLGYRGVSFYDGAEDF